jgi:pimeloyl-ACP methyl ester carboxylesterase
VQTEVPQTQYARSGDVSIAYQVVGEGEHDVVLVPGFVSNVELAWEDPLLASFYDRLSSFCRLIVFDKRGTGLSDRVEGTPPLETRMDDVRAVMDAVGAERAALCGVSEGGPLTLLFAAIYPERTSAVALYGSNGAVVVRTPDHPWNPTREEFERRSAEAPPYASPEWVRDFLERRAPSLPRDDDTVRWYGKFFRQSASPGAVAQLLRMNREIDIRHALSSIGAPTLLVHRLDDVIRIENSRYLAKQIPGARLVELPGADHVPWVDSEQVVAPIQRFLEEVWAERAWEDAEPDRVLATLLFTDIVGSTARAAELGDSAWRELLTEHNARVRRQLARFSGREIDTAGDGFFASGFDGPARAIHCACAIVDAVRELDLDLRVGLHTGECELIDEKIGGIAVSIGARVAAQAGPGEVLVSSTVKDLVAGSGIAFSDRGTAELKGVPGEWRLFAVER